jgi:4-amino-4-deoxy-L-arabinose transferase-like glycosyltransferase
MDTGQLHGEGNRIARAPAGPYAGALAAVAAAVALALGLWAIHLAAAGLGGISHYDEFYTLDRSLGFARHGDWWTVYADHEPTFKKPPLQYWMTAGLLGLGVEVPLALRLPSMAFALGTLLATAALAAALVPGRPWVMPASVLLLASSLQFWDIANTGLLDSGAALFTAVALFGFVRALDDPRWWYLVTAAIGVGALQKAPVALPLVAAALAGVAATRRWHGTDLRSIRTTRSFRRAALLSVALALAWPLLQALRHGPEALETAVGSQMLERFLPANEDGARGLGALDRLIIVDEPWLRWPAILALLALPFLMRRPAPAGLVAVLFAFVAAMALAQGQVFARYTVVVLPLLAAGLAGTVVLLLPRPVMALGAVAVLSAASAGPVKLAALRTAAIQPENVTEMVAATRSVAAALRPDEIPVYCQAGDGPRLIPGVISVYGGAARPAIRVRPGDDIPRTDAPQPPMRGLCPAADLPALAAGLGPVTVEDRIGPWVHWSAPGSG